MFDIQWWIYFGIITGAVVLGIIIATVTKPKSIEVEATKRNIPVPTPSTEAGIRRYRKRSDLLGSAIGYVLLLAAWPLVRGSFSMESTQTPVGLWLIVLFAALALSAGIARAVFRPFEPEPGAVRVSRTRELTAALYVPPRVVILPRIVTIIAAIAVVIASIAVAVSGRADLWLGTGLVAFGGVVALGLSLWLQHIIVARPQPLASLIDLAWDDSLRADAIAEVRRGWTLLLGLVAAGAAAIFTVVVVPPSWSSSLPQAVAAVAFAAVLCVNLAVISYGPTPVPQKLRETLA